jgi:hypothetical protein
MASLASAQTVQQLRERITDKDRRIREQTEEIERLTYAAGRAASHAAPPSLTTRQHDETIKEVTRAKEAATSAAEAASDAADATDSSAEAITTKLDLAKVESRKSFRELLLTMIGGFVTMIIGIVANDLRERRNHKWALQADRARQEQLEEHKQDVDLKLETITAFLDGRKKTADWKDLE